MNRLPLLVSLPSTRSSVRLLAKELGWAGDRLEEAEALFAVGLPPLMDTHTLPFLFGVSPRMITDMRRHPRNYYRRFRIRKRGGGRRSILAPRRFIKLIQRWVLEHILDRVELPACAMAYQKGSNIFRNAAPHAGHSNLLVVDIRDFFSSVRASSVRQSFE